MSNNELDRRIYTDYITARKNKEKDKIDFYSFLRAQIKNREIEMKTDKLSDEEIIVILQRQKKRIEESYQQAKKNNREDVALSLEKELQLIDKYLPAPLNSEELKELIQKIIDEEKASSMKDMGKVMSRVIALTRGRADARIIQQLVRQILTEK